MSEKSEGPGWWIASDGNWYPPELHPSVRAQQPVPVPTKMHVPTQPTVPDALPAWQEPAERDTHVGPQFPDLFQKALQGSYLADNVTVAGEGGQSGSTFTSARAGSSPAVGAGSGGSKRRWRKGS
jgi:hypothetical protein